MSKPTSSNKAINPLKFFGSRFKFLNGLDRKFEPIKREILRVDPLPTAEAVYAMVRKEAAHQIMLGVTNETHGIATGLIAGETDIMDWWTDGHKTASNKGAKKDTTSTSPTANTRNSTKNSNDRRSEGGFGGVAAVVGEEGEESFSVKGYQDGTDGRGTKRDGLYYVDEVVQSGTVMLAHGTTEREAWLWHKRLGHPSLGIAKLDVVGEGIISQIGMFGSCRRWGGVLQVVGEKRGKDDV
nr:ribonuclease H-like domain-containing protein [Tanacetum cinerariifolium]